MVLARLLGPADYGVFAVALVVQQIGRALVELGLPVPMVQREEPPTLHEQRAITGMVLLAGTGVAILTWVVALGLLPAVGVRSEVVRAAAVSCVAIPIFGLRLVPMVAVERSLAFGRLIAVEVSETIAFYAFAIPCAALDFGPYSLAGAVPASALVGAGVAFVVRPWSFGLGFDLRVVKPMARFGIAVSALHPIHLVRELSILTAASLAGGQGLAGFYSFAQRLFALHTAFMVAIQRVGLPILSRMPRGPDRDTRAASACSVAAVAAGFIMAVVAGTADPLIHVLFGPRWAPAGEVVLAAAPGMLMAASAGAVASSLALANRDGRTPLVAAAVSAACGAIVAAALCPGLGATGAGLASAASLLLGGWVLLRGQVETSRRSALTAIAISIVLTLMAAGAARHLTHGQDVVAIGQAMAIAACVWWAGAALLLRREVRLGWTVMRRTFPRGFSALGSNQPRNPEGR